MGGNDSPLSAFGLIGSLAVQFWYLFWVMFPAIGRMNISLNDASQFGSAPIRMGDVLRAIYPKLFASPVGKSM